MNAPENPPSSHGPELGPWNPGIQSQIPRHLLPLSTLFRAENVFTSFEDATELNDLTGIDLAELVRFRPERLALHELLIRVTGDFSVADGSRYEDLGINFRAMTATILTRYLAPQMTEIRAAYESARRQLAARIEGELAAAFAPAPSPSRNRYSVFRWLSGARDTAGAAQSFAQERQAEEWERKANASHDGLEKAACRALAKVAAALCKRHGRPWGSRELIGNIATDLACNDYCSEEIGRLIEPQVALAASREGYQLLPAQAHPFVMNTKGPSASGKSTLRPLQKILANRIGVRWNEFALISPDIWRKQLLDYASLGPDFRYGATLTGEELKIIDHKLDRHMRQKAEHRGMSHLVIDRFRFDSFAQDSDRAGSTLLTRFGHIVHLFFMVTPPQEIVERAWKRGLEVGRYKAVDDLLAHSVEAYSGMPQLFFTWAQREDMRVHFEFLDNSVAFGESPRTAAFGWNGRMFVLDVKCMLDVGRFRKVNINAGAADQLYDDPGLEDPGRNTDFLVQCAGRLREITFAEHATGRIYLRIVSGRVVWVDSDVLEQALLDPETRAGILAIAPGLPERAKAPPGPPQFVHEACSGERISTLGDWGNRADPGR